jgi:hypothetical protein
MDLTGVQTMTSKFLVAAAAATFVLAGGAALAQQDNNNPAPTYAKVGPAQSALRTSRMATTWRRAIPPWRR